MGANVKTLKTGREAAESFLFALCCSSSSLLPATGDNGTAQLSSSIHARRKGADQQLPCMATCDSLSGSRNNTGDILLEPGIWPCLYRGEYACLADFVQKPKAGTSGWFNIGIYGFVAIQWGSLWSTAQDRSVVSLYQHICPLFYQHKQAEQTLRLLPFPAQMNWAGQILTTSSYHNYYHNAESKAVMVVSGFQVSMVYTLGAISTRGCPLFMIRQSDCREGTPVPFCWSSPSALAQQESCPRAEREGLGWPVQWNVWSSGRGLSTSFPSSLETQRHRSGNQVLFRKYFGLSEVISDHLQPWNSRNRLPDPDLKPCILCSLQDGNSLKTANELVHINIMTVQCIPR